MKDEYEEDKRRIKVLLAGIMLKMQGSRCLPMEFSPKQIILPNVPRVDDNEEDNVRLEGFKEDNDEVNELPAAFEAKTFDVNDDDDEEEEAGTKVATLVPLIVVKVLISVLRS